MVLTFEILIIVTHANPDLDALGAVWVLKRFDPGWKEAGVEFVPAGETYQGKPVDSDPEVIHVDTGLGSFDHHQTRERTCATQLVFEFLLKEKPGQLANVEALRRLVEIVSQIDHFENCWWPEPDNDRYEFFLDALLDGMKKGRAIDDTQLAEFSWQCLDGVYASLKLKVEAEEELKEAGVEFQTVWGKAMGVEGKNDTVLKLAQKQGYVLAVRKDPEGIVRIKARPDSKVDLAFVYEELKRLDPEASWYLHISKKMLFNGSYHNPHVVPSKLSFEQILNLLKNAH